MMLVHGLLTLFRSHFFSIPGETGGLFLERSDNEREAVVVYMQDRGFNGYVDNMKNQCNRLTRYKLKWFLCKRLLEHLISGPKSYRDLSRNGSLENTLEAKTDGKF